MIDWNMVDRNIFVKQTLESKLNILLVTISSFLRHYHSDIGVPTIGGTAEKNTM